MTDETNVESTTDAPKELKSTDTGTIKAAMEAAKAEAVVEETQAEKPKDDPSSGDDDAKPADAAAKKSDRLPRWVQERLIREREKVTRETEERLRKELQPVKAQPEKAESAPRRKTMEDFDFDTDAYTEYLVEQKLQENERKRTEAEQRKRQEESVAAFKKRIDSFEERVGAGAWEDIETSPINQDPKFAPLAALIQGEENDLDIAHHLALNPDEADRIIGLRPLAMARELSELAERLKGPATLPRKTTTAPPPPKTVQGSGKSSDNIYSPTMSSEQRIRLLREQRQTRR